MSNTINAGAFKNASGNSNTSTQKDREAGRENWNRIFLLTKIAEMELQAAVQARTSRPHKVRKVIFGVTLTLGIISLISAVMQTTAVTGIVVVLGLVCFITYSAVILLEMRGIEKRRKRLEKDFLDQAFEPDGCFANIPAKLLLDNDVLEGLQHWIKGSLNERELETALTLACEYSGSIRDLIETAKNLEN